MQAVCFAGNGWITIGNGQTFHQSTMNDTATRFDRSISPVPQPAQATFGLVEAVGLQTNRLNTAELVDREVIALVKVNRRKGQDGQVRNYPRIYRFITNGD